MSCRFPGARDPEQYWDNLTAGRVSIKEVPAARWRWQDHYDDSQPQEGGHYCRWGGFIDDVDAFDAPFFNLSPLEAEALDPQQRLGLELAWACFEDAGMRPSKLSGGNVGVFIGFTNLDYKEIIELSPIGPYYATGTLSSVIPNRISHHFNLRGPSAAVDTACSSSLHALHLACRALQNNECEVALTGGISLLLTPKRFIWYGKAGILSPTGALRAFDENADGTVRGEGAGFILLKPLARALADGNRVVGVIKGTAVNHGGKNYTLTYPSAEAQADVIAKALQAAGISPSDITYVEAHGTGTFKGDPIEVKGLLKAFQADNTPLESQNGAGPWCGLGTVKPNIGHLEGAAGIAGVIKVLLALRHKTLPPLVNFTKVNSRISLGGAFYFVDKLQPWEPCGDGRLRLPRAAGVSSFGFAGTNAHVIVAEAPIMEQEVTSTTRVPQGPAVVVLSARDSERLNERAEQIRQAIVRQGLSDDNLIDVAYTLNVGREPMEERLGLLVRSLEELDQKLQALLNGDGVPGLYRGQARKSEGVLTNLAQDEAFQGAVDKWIEHERLDMLLELWSKGLEVDWSKLYGAAKPQLVSLPTYPFAKERYWISPAASEQGAASRGAPSGPTTAVLHPLLHGNTSDLSRQRYTSTFTGEEFFLTDHQVRVDGAAVHKVLPGVAYLEMARAAVEQALPARPESTVIELRNVVWAQPVVVAEKKRVNIALAANDQEEIDYEIYSQETDQEIVYCQGHAVLSRQEAPARLDIEQLEGQMTQGRLEPSDVYAACARMGLVYGPSFQGITAIHQGRGQLLARLRLPKEIENTSGDYVLHPSLMDGALQACVGLIEGSMEGSNQPRLPFALESLRIVSPCSREMVAWARYAPGSQAGDKVVKLDIDLCDERGVVCAQMRGFSSRALGKEIGTTVAQGQAIGSLLAVPVWQASGVEAPAETSPVEYTERHVVLCELWGADQLGASLPHAHCLSLQAESQKNIAQRYSEYALACLERIQTILQGKPHGKALVQIVVPDHQEQALFAGLSGILKTAALENPQFVGQLILVPASASVEELVRRLQEEKTRRPAAGLDILIRYEDGGRQVLRWQEVPEEQEEPPIAFKDKGVYLITGGMGGLGLLFAKEILAQTREARVVLTGRSALGAERQALLDGLSAQAGRVSYRQADVSDLDQVAPLIAAIKVEHGQLNGILHCAGMIADSFILKKTGAQFSEVLAPKVAGAFNLDQASKDVELDFFALFSSIAGAMGNVGQVDYATANAFMDQFAAYRNRQVAAGERRGRTLSINWPLWQSGGMGIDEASEELLRQNTGIRPMRTSTGLRAFYRSLPSPFDQIMVIEGALSQIRRALLGGLAAPAEPQTEQPAPADEIDTESFAKKTQDYLRKQFSGLLKAPPHNIDPHAALEKYGIDSILAMQLTNQLEKTFGSLSKTLFFEYQTIRDLSEYFIAHHSPSLTALLAASSGRAGETTSIAAQPPTPASTKPTSSRRFIRARSSDAGPTTEFDSIAIVGLSGRYPEAVDIEAYWRNLRDGEDCVVEVPKERWDWREYFSEDRSQSGRHYSKWGGFIAGVDEFDPLFFNISPKEAKYIDPQERLFLQHVWMAIEDAGYTRASLQAPYEQRLAGDQDLPGQVGVYVGVMYTEYQLFGAEAGVLGARLGFASSAASIANRVSYALNLHGPSMTLDTMCSSSLTAIHIACQDLKLGRTSMAIAGGVNVSIHPNKYLALSAGQFISSDGHCQSFGEGGDGYIPGEGVGVVVLKRLSDAQRDGDHIYGVIRGSALNHGGKTNGYTVPNPQAQAGAISRALAESRTDARQISYIEAHGTGTRLGDPIEIAALSKAFQRYTQETGFCLIGSAKSNIGHCESAAGIAGLTKVLLQMRHQQIAPSLHSRQLNPNIDFAKTPFVVNQELRPWEPPVIDGRTMPRIAGISSFGAGGSNAHLIVEEYQGPAPQAMAFANVVIALSARTAEQLRQKARDLLEFVRPRLNAIDLVGMAYTLQVGREAMEERLGFVASSVEQLAEKLQAYVSGEEGIEDVYRGQASRNKEALSLFSADADLRQTIDRWIANKRLSKLVELWVKGLEVDWGKLYGEDKPRRVSLPTYPFAKERYWIDIAAIKQGAANGASPSGPATAVLHPLLHSNDSDLSEQRYSSTFTGEEFFLADHQARTNGHAGQKALPGVAYLEMARAAIEHALPARPESTVLELRNVVWAQPIVVAEKKRVNITLAANDHEEIDYEIYSQETGHEVVHCQGRAVLSSQSAPVPIDIERLKGQMRQGQLEPSSVQAACASMGLVHGPSFQGITAIHRGGDQLLARLRLPKVVEDTSGDYVLHPSLMDGALQACIGLIDGSTEGSDQPRMPFALESLRIVSPCSREMAAWVRYSPGSQAGDDVIKLDVDLCDEQGNIAAQMRGASWRRTAPDIVEPVIDKTASPVVSAASKEITLAAPARREIVFVPYKLATPAPVELKKPTAISLVAPSALVSSTALSVPRAVASEALKMESRSLPLAVLTRLPITLSNAPLGAPINGSAAPAVSSVRLYDDGAGIFSIQIDAPLSGDTPAKDVIAHLLQALDRAQQEASVKVLMISGAESWFLRGGREDYNQAVEQRLFQAIVSFPYPVIAVLEGDTIGAGFLFAALCDFMVCNEDALYGYTDAQRHFYPTIPEGILFGERFGEVLAQDLLYLSTASTGKRLRRKGWTCPILPGAQVEAYAKQLASALATKSQDALRLLKQHLTRRQAGLIEALTRVEVGAAETENPPDARISTVSGTDPEYLHLDTSAENVLVIKFRCEPCGGSPSVSEGGAVSPSGVWSNLAAELGRIFAEVDQNAYYKAIVLVSEYPDFLPGTEGAIPPIPEDVALEFQRLVAESNIPVVAALDGNAKGAAWLVSQFCDACVYSQAGVYSSANVGQSPALAQTAAAIFAHRFGGEAANEILLTGADYSGVDLRRRVGALIVAEQDQVLLAALKVAESWAELPRGVLAAWKKQTATTIREKIRSLPAGVEWERKDEAPEPAHAEPTPIALHSKVVTATAHPDGVAVVKMEDREAKNMFSEALIEGLREAFEHIEQTPAYKVVILTGYDNYFASGGDKESLLAIQQGRAKFTDVKIFQAPLDCKLPVIAAMQGHGIGAGWAMGMFADIALIGEESRYVSPYMDYGFTPGAGATWILAEKMGKDLTRESLLTARHYAGSELKDRGLLLRVLPRAEAYQAAMALAKQIAQAPRHRLMGLKQQLTQYWRQPLEETYRLELAMHEKTFVGRSDTLAQIQNKFYQEVEPQGGSQRGSVEPAKPSVNGHNHAAAANGSHLSIDGDALGAVTSSLKTLLANELQVRESDVDDNAQFVDLGLDSISGVTWIRKINEKYHTSIEATKVYSYPTLAQFSRYVKEEAGKQGMLMLPSQVAPHAINTPAPTTNGALSHRSSATERAAKKLPLWGSRPASRFAAGAPTTRPSESITAQPVAVIGMAGQFPQARNIEEFWQNIADGRNCITEVPRRRWDVDVYYQPGEAVVGKTTSRWAGTIDEYDLFDPLFFDISPVEAESMDPQQRLFLQACWHSIENAGYAARSLSGSKCGVFVGCAAGDYHHLSRQHQLSAQGFTGGASSILAARISYFLNLRGPCISIDTACSSSLVAIAQACDSLTSGASDLALAGGVYVMVGPEMHIKTSQAGMLSPEGKCFTFDERADGFVPGEGVGVVLLKRLADAERDHDIIHAVIQGWGVNQDGRTNGITAPNPESQTRLEQEVYDKFQIDPTGIQLIEAHGTGTKLGDPIEVEGLRNAFKKYTQKKGYCALGSVKSNIGHCLTAAGIAGVIKLLQALKRKQLPPTINFERLNEHIDLKESPFYVNTRLQDWEPSGAARRQAAISSFGFSGTNAHMVIGEYTPPAEVKRPVAVVTQNTKTIVPLSAKTSEQLKQKAGDLLDFIRKEAQSINLIEMAYTLQVGREVMDERLGVLALSVEQLAEKLEAFVNGERRIEDLHRGRVNRGAESANIINQDDDVKETIVEKWVAKKKFSKLLELWVNGLDLDWNKLYGEAPPQRITLPTYPFAKERYWIDMAPSAAVDGRVAAEGAAAAILHPLLHCNTSDLSEQRYSSTFTGEEFFLTDHRVRTDGGAVQKFLPGVAYLEMARAAIEQAAPIRPESSILELCDTVWLKPVVVTAPKQVSIALFATDNDRVDYEIYSIEAEQETLHCQGQAVFSRQSAPARLDIEQLRRQMGQGRLDAADVYTIFGRMGLNYGPAHQGITVIHLGEGQVIAQLEAPAVVEANRHEYVLHPGLMDSALQASIGLIVAMNNVPTKPYLPFAVESLRIVSACAKEMVAWARYSKGSKPGDKTVKVDIDLCDQQGNVCVQVRGFASRVLDGDVKSTRQSDIKPMIQVKSNPVLEENSRFDGAFYRSLISDVVNRRVSVDEAVELG
jgi:acyl transferase domain-containing protein/enoyl-CoA hydratase/carnithine racemase/acyl carrier protein